MDDRSFQRELHALQQQLTRLSVQASPIPLSVDPFTREVDSLNGMLHLMEERLAKCKASFTQFAESPPTRTASGPGFGKLFTDMHHRHQETLETRLEALTKTVSDLEDRLDSLDPKCVTPSASSDGSGDEYVLPADFQNALPYTLLGPSQLCSSTVVEENDVVPGVSNLCPIPDYAQSQEARSPQMVSCLFPAKSRDEVVPQPLQNTSHLTSGFQHGYGSPGVWSQCNQEASLWPGAIKSESGDDSLPQRPQTSVEGVAFRDREIARMDERLWTTQERLKDCEAAMAEDQITIARLRLEREECRAVARKYRDRNHRLKDSVLQLDRRLDVQSSRNQELESWLVASKNTRNDLETALERLQRSYESAEARAFRRSQKIVEMEDQRETTLRNHDRRLKTLQDWCREKDFDIGQKAQVISRNSSLLTQREDEIKELQERLRAVGKERELGVNESVQLSTQPKDDAPQQGCPSQSITNQDWYGDLIKTDNHHDLDNNASTCVAPQCVPSGPAIAASAFQPEWLLPTEGPYDGSIFYGIDPSSSEHCPQEVEDQMRPQVLDHRTHRCYPEEGTRDYLDDAQAIPGFGRRKSNTFGLPRHHDL